MYAHSAHMCVPKKCVVLYCSIYCQCVIKTLSVIIGVHYIVLYIVSAYYYQWQETINHNRILSVYNTVNTVGL